MNREYGVDRRAQDAWAARSHVRAAAAWDEGRFDDEVVAVEVPQRKGEPIVIDRDEGIRAGTTVEALAELGPAFTPEGTVTAGNASQISDGACAVVVAGETAVRRLGLTPLARIEAYRMWADRFASLHTVPALALDKARKKIGVDPAHLGVARSERGLRGGRGARDADARGRRADREPQRRCGGTRPPDRRERCPHRAHDSRWRCGAATQSSAPRRSAAVAVRATR